MTTPTTATLSRSLLLRLALESELDPRTIRRALRDGVSSLRAEASRERLTRAAKKLRVKLPP